MKKTVINIQGVHLIYHQDLRTIKREKLLQQKIEGLGINYFEACLNKEGAFKREKYLKTHYGKMFLGNRLKSYFIGCED